MAVKVYLPTDSLHVYIEFGQAYPTLIQQGHVRILPQTGDKITLEDSLLSVQIVSNIPYGDFQDSGGTPLGGDMDATLLALAKIL